MLTEATNTMKVIGITGGIGAGKSRILSILEEEYHAVVILADDVARELQEPGQPGFVQLTRLFGEMILDSDGRINRPLLADIIFHDESRLIQVNGIIHPLTWERIRQMIGTSKAMLVAVESALFDRETQVFCDEI
ncbi:MAG: dephospho-CoA kinase, partial [Lachnospiraceae bacterium]